MDFRILGPLEVSSDGETFDLGGQKHRALLAMLLLSANRVVSRDLLIEALWEAAPPETAQKALQVYISQLRKVLGKDRLVTKSPGYLLRVNPDELDLERFRRLQDEGRFGEALALWRGPPLSDMSYQRFAQTEISRINELRLACLESRIERDLETGKHAELVGELDALVGEHPLRERLRGQLMLTLYRAGRQAEALEAYQQARAALVEELGIEPGRPLRELQQAILNQDQSLDAPSAAGSAEAARKQPPVVRESLPLPRGSVTLLFADVEGSTRLLYSLGSERYGGVRKRARTLVRSTAAQNRGYEVDWAGDGVFLAFERARDAVAAATELQRALADEPWEPDAVLRMRIGIHTGEPEVGDEGYVGLDVHVAARICAAAHGGQIVVSRATRDFVGDDPVSGFSFRPLGSHRLRDVANPQPLFQLVAPGIESSFPPLQTLAGATLPALHHRLVGRRRNLDEIQALLARPDVRLVTITGPGGAGKSRLALEVAGAAAVERPVHLVGLAPISDPELVPAAIARTLGVQESAGRSLAETLAEALADTGALLFLDNLEHLAPAAKHVAELLHRTPGLDVLTTSRAPLRLSGEYIVPLDPLAVEDAATLFSELAAARGIVVRQDALPSVREICRRLDGLPLAIELVAARLVVLPPARILKALDEGLALDMEGPIDLPERQRTLRATIDWSYDLLTESQRELLGALAVFAGGCALDDAQAIARSGASFLADLEALVAWSLLRSDVSDGDVRLSMLETVRENAVARLDTDGGLEDLRRRHAERFLELAADAEKELAGPAQAEWLTRLELELDNIRAALDWCFASGRVEDALRAVSALERFWRAHGHVSEARRWLSLGLGLATDASANIRADALWTAARQAVAQSDWDAAQPLLEDALELFREQKRGREVVFALSELGSVALRQDDPDRAALLCEEALSVARDLGDPRAESGALNILAEVARTRGEHERALALSEEAVALRRGLGDPLLVADSTYHLGVAAFGSGDLDRAEGAFEGSLALARELGDAVFTGAALCMLGTVELLRGDLPHASDHLHESLTIYIELADDRSTAECLCALGGHAAASGRPEDAARLWGAADSLRGDHPLEYAEPEIEAQYAPVLVEALGVERFAQLREEGRRVGHGRMLAEIGAVVASSGAE
jgi:predicted ATPase/DNA-binding SARP family transcriptional activator